MKIMKHWRNRTTGQLVATVQVDTLKDNIADPKVGHQVVAAHHRRPQENWKQVLPQVLHWMAVNGRQRHRRLPLVVHLVDVLVNGRVVKASVDVVQWGLSKQIKRHQVYYQATHSWNTSIDHSRKEVGSPGNYDQRNQQLKKLVKQHLPDQRPHPRLWHLTRLKLNFVAVNEGGPPGQVDQEEGQSKGPVEQCGQGEGDDDLGDLLIWKMGADEVVVLRLNCQSDRFGCTEKNEK